MTPLFRKDYKNSKRNLCLRKHEGFTYLGILFILSLIALAVTGASMIWQVEQQREKERALIFVGQQYIDAIASYYHSAPGGAKKYPRSISELLRDPRYLTVKRHLRKPWNDPITGSVKWGIIYTKEGGIAGVYSLSEKKPLKLTGFNTLEKFLANKISLQSWRFMYIAALDEQTRSENDSTINDNNLDNAVDEQDKTDEGEDETGEELIPKELIDKANP